MPQTDSKSRTTTKHRQSRARLLSNGDIALMAGVQSNVVANWKRRYEDFPEPAQVNGKRDLYRRADVVRFLKDLAEGRLAFADACCTNLQEKLESAQRTRATWDALNKRVSKLRA